MGPSLNRMQIHLRHHVTDWNHPSLPISIVDLHSPHPAICTVTTIIIILPDDRYGDAETYNETQDLTHKRIPIQARHSSLYFNNNTSKGYVSFNTRYLQSLGSTNIIKAIA